MGNKLCISTNLGGSVVKNPPAGVGDARDTVSIPRLGRSHVEESGAPLQYSSLGNPMDGGAWLAAVHWVTKESDMTQRLNKYLFTIITSIILTECSL